MARKLLRDSRRGKKTARRRAQAPDVERVAGEKKVVARLVTVQAAQPLGAQLLTAQRKELAEQLQRLHGNRRFRSELVFLAAQSTPQTALQRAPVEKHTGPPPSGKDVVIIVGRPSGTIPKRESEADKENMFAWRAAARALSPIVMEGLTADKAFSGLRKIKFPIRRLYIIAHASESGIGEVSPSGVSRGVTVDDLTRRISEATGPLGDRAPRSVVMLSCFGGNEPRTMAEIGAAVGAERVRAPVHTTVITGRTLRVGTKTGDRFLTKDEVKKLSDAKLRDFVAGTDALEYYDYVPGVPHPKSEPSVEERLGALVKVIRKTGMIPYVAYNSAPDEPGAVPYWKASVERREASEEDIPSSDYVRIEGLIEVLVPKPSKER